MITISKISFRDAELKAILKGIQIEGKYINKAGDYVIIGKMKKMLKGL